MVLGLVAGGGLALAAAYWLFSYGYEGSYFQELPEAIAFHLVFTGGFCLAVRCFTVLNVWLFALAVYLVSCAPLRDFSGLSFTTSAAEKAHYFSGGMKGGFFLLPVYVFDIIYT